MKTSNTLRVSLATAVAFLGFITGYLAAGKSEMERALRAQIAQLQATIDILQANTPAVDDQTGDGIRQAGETPPGIPAGQEKNLTKTNANPNEVTERDIVLSLEMNERASKGEYILSFERPADRKFMKASVDDLVARMSSNSAPALNQLFSSLGVPKETGERLKVHQTKIQQASLEVEMAMQQLLEARKDYDERVRASLTEEQYIRYTDFEASRPAEREYRELESYATRMGISIDPSRKDQVQALMRQSKAYTDRTWHGPYDSMPDPAIGTEMVANQLEAQIADITTTSSSLTLKALEAGLPRDLVEMLGTYYSDRLGKKEQILNRVLSSERPPAPLTAGQ